MTIELLRFRGAAYNFSITIGDECFITSNSIAKLLGLDVIIYNDVLVEHVIKHKDYKGDLFLNYFIFSTDTKNNEDVTFNLNNVSKETYLECFKETFIKELTLLSF